MSPPPPFSPFDDEDADWEENFDDRDDHCVSDDPHECFWELNDEEYEEFKKAADDDEEEDFEHAFYEDEERRFEEEDEEEDEDEENEMAYESDNFDSHPSESNDFSPEKDDSLAEWGSQTNEWGDADTAWRENAPLSPEVSPSIPDQSPWNEEDYDEDEDYEEVEDTINAPQYNGQDMMQEITLIALQAHDDRVTDLSGDREMEDPSDFDLESDLESEKNWEKIPFGEDPTHPEGFLEILHDPDLIRPLEITNEALPDDTQGEEQEANGAFEMLPFGDDPDHPEGVLEILSDPQSDITLEADGEMDEPDSDDHFNVIEQIDQELESQIEMLPFGDDLTHPEGFIDILKDLPINDDTEESEGVDEMGGTDTSNGATPVEVDLEIEGRFESVAFGEDPTHIEGIIDILPDSGSISDTDSDSGSISDTDSDSPHNFEPENDLEVEHTFEVVPLGLESGESEKSGMRETREEQMEILLDPQLTSLPSQDQEKIDLEPNPEAIEAEMNKKATEETHKEQPELQEKVMATENSPEPPNLEKMSHRLTSITKIIDLIKDLEISKRILPSSRISDREKRQHLKIIQEKARNLTHDFRTERGHRTTSRRKVEKSSLERRSLLKRLSFLLLPRDYHYATAFLRTVNVEKKPREKILTLFYAFLARRTREKNSIVNFSHKTWHDFDRYVKKRYSSHEDLIYQSLTEYVHYYLRARAAEFERSLTQKSRGQQFTPNTYPIEQYDHPSPVPRPPQIRSLSRSLRHPAVAAKASKLVGNAITLVQNSAGNSSSSASPSDPGRTPPTRAATPSASKKPKKVANKIKKHSTQKKKVVKASDEPLSPANELSIVPADQRGLYKFNAKRISSINPPIDTDFRPVSVFNADNIQKFTKTIGQKSHRTSHSGFETNITVMDHYTTDVQAVSRDFNSMLDSASSAIITVIKNKFEESHKYVKLVKNENCAADQLEDKRDAILHEYYLEHSSEISMPEADWVSNMKENYLKPGGLSVGIPLYILGDLKIFKLFFNPTLPNYVTLSVRGKRTYNQYSAIFDTAFDLATILNTDPNNQEFKKRLNGIFRNFESVFAGISRIFNRGSNELRGRTSNPIDALQKSIKNAEKSKAVKFERGIYPIIKNGLLAMNLLIEKGFENSIEINGADIYPFMELLVNSELLNREVTWEGGTIPLRQWFYLTDGDGLPNWKAIITQRNPLAVADNSIMPALFKEASGLKKGYLSSYRLKNWQKKQLKAKLGFLTELFYFTRLGEGYHKTEGGDITGTGVGFPRKGKNYNFDFLSFVDLIESKYGPGGATLRYFTSYMRRSYWQVNTLSDIPLEVVTALEIAHKIMINRIFRGVSGLNNFRNTVDLSILFSGNDQEKDQFAKGLEGNILNFETLQSFIARIDSNIGSKIKVTAYLDKFGEQQLVYGQSAPEQRINAKFARLQRLLIEIGGYRQLSHIVAEKQGRAGLVYTGVDGEQHIARPDFRIGMQFDSGAIMALIGEVLGFYEKTKWDTVYSEEKELECGEGLDQGLAMIYAVMELANNDLYKYYRNKPEDLINNIGRIAPLFSETDIDILIEVLLYMTEPNLKDVLMTLHQKFISYGLTIEEAKQIQKVFGIINGVITDSMIKWWENFENALNFIVDGRPNLSYYMLMWGMPHLGTTMMCPIEYPHDD